MATLDATTQAEYAAEVNATDRAQVIIDALAAPVYARVYNADDNVMGEGTMTSPWATISGDKLIPTTVDGFFVSAVDDWNEGWYFRFESGSRHVDLSFGLAGSGKEVEWSLSTWDLGTRAGITTGEITVTGNRPPVWSGAPSALTLAAGATQSFSAYASDPDGDPLSFSLVGAASGYSITSAGVLTAGSASASVTIRVTDTNGLTADTVCSITVVSASSTTMHDNTFETDPWNPPSGWSLSKTSGGGEFTTLQTTTPRSGSRSIRFRIVRDPVNRDVWRNEFQSGVDTRLPWCTSATAPTPVEQWLGYSMRLNSSWVNDTDWEVLGQWHNGNTQEGTWAGGIANWDTSPVLAIYGAQDYLRLVIRWQDEVPAVRSPLYNQISTNVIAINPIKGLWIDLVWNVVWDWRTYANGGTGKVHLWWRRPGESWSSTANYVYNGPVGSNDYQASPLLRGSLPYFKFGIYKRGWGETWGDSSLSSERIVEYDNMKIIRSGGIFSQVVPPGDPF